MATGAFCFKRLGCELGSGALASGYKAPRIFHSTRSGKSGSFLPLTPRRGGALWLAPCLVSAVGNSPVGDAICGKAESKLLRSVTRSWLNKNAE